MTDVAEARRADARANRARILAVARQAIAADPAASLNAVAKAAGVGAGTLYRHFPSREALLVAVFRHEIDVLVADAPALLLRHSPLRAFRLWCDRFVAFGAVKHGIAATLGAAMAESDFEELHQSLIGALRQLMAASQGAGGIRPDSDPEDVLTLLGLLLQLSPQAHARSQSARILDLIFRGLHAGGEHAVAPS